MAQTTRLVSFGPAIARPAPFGPFHVVSAFHVVHLVKYNLYSFNKTLISNINTKKRKNLPRAQTTRPASSGPVIVVAAFHDPYRTLKASIVPINVSFTIKKPRRTEKKNVPMAQTTRLASFGPVLTVPASHLRL
jgi:hypothetical protein